MCVCLGLFRVDGMGCEWIWTKYSCVLFETKVWVCSGDIDGCNCTSERRRGLLVLVFEAGEWERQGDDEERV